MHNPYIEKLQTESAQSVFFDLTSGEEFFAVSEGEMEKLDFFQCWEIEFGHFYEAIELRFNELQDRKQIHINRDTPKYWRDFLNDGLPLLFFQNKKTVKEDFVRIGFGRHIKTYFIEIQDFIRIYNKIVSKYKMKEEDQIITFGLCLYMIFLMFQLKVSVELGELDEFKSFLKRYQKNIKRATRQATRDKLNDQLEAHLGKISGIGLDTRLAFTNSLLSKDQRNSFDFSVFRSFLVMQFKSLQDRGIYSEFEFFKDLYDLIPFLNPLGDYNTLEDFKEDYRPDLREEKEKPLKRWNKYKYETSKNYFVGL